VPPPTGAARSGTRGRLPSGMGGSAGSSGAISCQGPSGTEIDAFIARHLPPRPRLATRSWVQTPVSCSPAVVLSRRLAAQVSMMTAPYDPFQLLLKDAREDPRIVGLVLTGSRGKGLGNESSDFDVLLIVRPEALETYRAPFSERVLAGLRLVGDIAAGARAHLRNMGRAAGVGNLLQRALQLRRRLGTRRQDRPGAKPGRRQGAKSSLSPSSTRPWARTPTACIAR
jgi:hypothetical protein